MEKQRFSQKHGYTTVENAIVRECITEEIENSICSACDFLTNSFKSDLYDRNGHSKELERFLWLNFLNLRLADFEEDGRYYVVLTTQIRSKQRPWYEKLDILEMAIRYLLAKYPDSYRLHENVVEFICYINHEFERHNYAYRIVGDSIVEITSEEECSAIEEALLQSTDIVSRHLANALDSYAKRPNGDYVNSIKESISAVEAACRQLTGASTLGDALKALDKKGIKIPGILKVGFEKLYAYTNHPGTGIRHALMDMDGAYVPGANEARYMLITCSAFINYLRLITT